MIRGEPPSNQQIGLEVTNTSTLEYGGRARGQHGAVGQDISSWPGERHGQPAEGVAAAGGEGGAELQGGRLPGALHRPRDRQKRKILGPLSVGPHTRAPH